MNEIRKIATVAVVWFVSLPFAYFWSGFMNGLELPSSPFSVMAGLFAVALYFSLSKSNPNTPERNDE